MMVCPKCAHPVGANLAYCEYCGSYLAAARPKANTSPTITYRFDLYAQPEGSTPSMLNAHGTTMLYVLFRQVNTTFYLLL